jgi:NAD(P)-dependent dehydrogenase (short-subunit alcohol dehydrogenase family)
LTKQTPSSIFITGGTTGIGLGIAQGFARSGAQVTATGLTDAEVSQAKADPANAGIEFQTLDVRDAKAVEAALGSRHRLDALINCAGQIRRAQAELDPEVFAQTVDVNLNGTLRCCTAARPALKAARGAIVNTASMLSFFGGGQVPGYSASKGGGGATHQVPGHCLCPRWHSRQCHRTGLDCHATHPGHSG